MTGIIYPKTWYNLNSGIEKFSNQKRNEIKVAVKETENTIKELHVVVPEGYYENIEDLFAAILKGSVVEKDSLFGTPFSYEIKNAKKFSFEYDKILKKVKVTYDKNAIVKIILSEQLKFMLGFKNTILENNDVAEYPPTLNAGLTCLYIYTDIIEPQIIGNVNAQLLRIVHISGGKHGDSVEKLFNDPHYVPIVKKEFDRISINVKDDTGQLVEFVSGNIVVNLHFRKKRQLFLE